MNQIDQHKANLLERIQSRTAHIGVVGMGYVGLPLALTLVERAGLRVAAFDVDAKKIEALNRGESYIMHLGAERVRAARETGRFDAAEGFDRLSEPDALLIAVPTPLTEQREPNMAYVDPSGPDPPTRAFSCAARSAFPQIFP